MNTTEKELLKKIAELERENRRLKENQEMKLNIRRKDALNSIKNLLEKDTQSYQALANKMGISDRTLRMFALGDSDNTSDKTLGILGDYFTEEFKSSYKDLALYRAYANAKAPEEREQIYNRLNSLFDGFLNEFNKIYDKRTYSIKEKGIVATGEIVDEGFLVHKGSKGVRDYVRSANVEVLDKKRNALISEGIIERDGDKIVFLQDHKFNSPSGAANMIVGSSANGRTRWKSGGITLKELEPDLYEQERGFIYSKIDTKPEERNQNRPIYPLNGSKKLNCTSKKPNGIFIDGLYYEEINDWTRVLPLILKILYEKNPVFFKRMIDGKEIVKDKGDLIIADYKVRKNRNNIEGTEYYVEQCFSANAVRKYAGRIIKYWNNNSGNKTDVKVKIKKTRF